MNTHPPPPTHTHTRGHFAYLGMSLGLILVTLEWGEMSSRSEWAKASNNTDMTVGGIIEESVLYVKDGENGVELNLGENEERSGSPGTDLQ